MSAILHLSSSHWYSLRLHDRLITSRTTVKTAKKTKISTTNMVTMSVQPTGGSFGKVQTMATRTITSSRVVKTARRELLGGVSEAREGNSESLYMFYFLRSCWYSFSSVFVFFFPSFWQGYGEIKRSLRRKGTELLFLSTFGRWCLFLLWQCTEIVWWQPEI